MSAASLRACICACALALFPFAGPAFAQALKPFQQQALDRILTEFEPSLRPMMREQLTAALAVLNEEQVNMMLESFTGSDPGDASADDHDTHDSADDGGVASPEDLAYNRAQYEPVMRRAWDAGKAFDTFVTTTLAEHCPPNDGYAVFGLAWRYEVYALSPTWPTVSQNIETEIEVIGASYAPQDGRYDFDFSAVRLTFDRSTVERAIVEACTEYRRIGEAFMREARADAGDEEIPPNGARIERSANAGVSAVRQRLERVLGEQAPGANNAVLIALMNGERVN